MSNSNPINLGNLDGRYVPRSLVWDGTDVSQNNSYADWQITSPQGYGYHWRVGTGSTLSTAAFGIGTDRGSGNGILLSHKNTGSAIQVDHQAGSGIGVYLNTSSVNPAMWVDMYSGSGGVRFVCKNGQAYSDGQSTAGSTIFTSATAAFTAGDVGQAITQTTSRDTNDPYGCIQSGTTIAAVTNATTVTLSQPAQFTSSGGVIFRVGGRVPGTGLTILSAYDTDNTTVLFQFRKASASLSTAVTISPVTGDTTRVSLAVKASNAGTMDALQIQESGGAAHIRVTQPSSSKAASLVIGKAALATTATDGYIYLPTVSGAPTGVPTTQAGTAAMVVDTTNSKLWVYVGGAWKSTTLA